MKENTGILAEQSTWLKLIILLISFTLGLDASFRQLLWLLGVFLLIFISDLSVFSKLLIALRRILPFLAGYWVFATLFTLQFPAMLLFSLQVLYFLVITVYCVGTIDMKHFLQDTGYLQKYRFSRSLIYLILATSLFIRKYFMLLGERQISGGDSIKNVLASFASLIGENFAHAMEVEDTIKSSLEHDRGHRVFFTFPNFLAFCFLAAVVIVGSL
ncbi:MAG TPA: hypothetical protein P5533_02865 [Candidatus Cloacimonadota bacterium]|nr:hypothetical protein [Candidatus Cloacimonadota bacterium]